MITSSLLTLVVVPVVYCYLDDLAAWSHRKWGRTQPQSASRRTGGGSPPDAALASKIPRLP